MFDSWPDQPTPQQVRRALARAERGAALDLDEATALLSATGEDLERKQVTTVADALREVPGVEVVESRSRGSVTNVFIRGADTDQTLVLIDGVRVNSTTPVPQLIRLLRFLPHAAWRAIERVPPLRSHLLVIARKV